MSIVLGIDPGPETCGVVYYDIEDRRALWPSPDMPVADVLADIARCAGAHVVIEQVESYGIAGGSLLRTAEVGGRLWQRALDVGLPVTLMPRREVCRVLSVVGGGKDAQVRRAMIARHGGTQRAAVGVKASPGPLYGVSRHAWQALGLVVAWDELRRMGAP